MGRRAAAVSAVLFFVQCLWIWRLSRAEPDPGVAPMEETEREALYLTVQGFVGNQWDGRNLFPDPCGWTPIQGVSCDVYGGRWYITAVDVGPVLDNSLECSPEAELSTHLFKLKHLRSLSLFRCFTDQSVAGGASLSQDWQKLSGSLETLEFRSNAGLRGGIPPGLGLLSNLQSLVLVENSLTGQLPPELGNLVRLRRLSLAGNQLSGQISAYNDWSELLILDLSRNSLSGPLPPSILSMNALLKLDLSSNQLNGRLPVAKQGSLTLLDLRNNSFSGVAGLAGMAALQYLLLSDNPLRANIADLGLENLRNLIALDLSNTSLRGEIPETIAKLRKLRFVALNDNDLSGRVPKSLEDLTELHALYLSGNNLRGELEFSEEFYARMRRRFACQNNAELCYRARARSRQVAPPAGVRQCWK